MCRVFSHMSHTRPQGRMVSWAPERAPNTRNFSDRVLLAPRRRQLLPGYSDSVPVNMQNCQLHPHSITFPDRSCCPERASSLGFIYANSRAASVHACMKARGIYMLSVEWGRAPSCRSESDAVLTDRPSTTPRLCRTGDLSRCYFAPTCFSLAAGGDVRGGRSNHADGGAAARVRAARYRSAAILRMHAAACLVASAVRPQLQAAFPRSRGNLGLHHHADKLPASVIIAVVTSYRDSKALVGDFAVTAHRAQLVWCYTKT